MAPRRSVAPWPVATLPRATLAGLVHTARLYTSLTDYDVSYLEFRRATAGVPNLVDPGHRLALLRWLNRWGCRQFRPSQHEAASVEIAEWYAEHGALLPDADAFLWDLDWEMGELALGRVAAAYDALVERAASRRVRNGVPMTVSVGPTGMSKVLFALRLRALLPWDSPVRAVLGADGSGHSYEEYLRCAAAVCTSLARECASRGLTLCGLPGCIGRPQATIAKLIDEY